MPRSWVPQHPQYRSFYSLSVSFTPSSNSMERDPATSTMAVLGALGCAFVTAVHGALTRPHEVREDRPHIPSYPADQGPAADSSNIFSAQKISEQRVQHS